MKFVEAHIHLSDGGYSHKVGEIVEDAMRSNVVALVSNSIVADQIFQNFTDFFGVRGVRDKRHEEGTIGVKAKLNSLTMEGN